MKSLPPLDTTIHFPIKDIENPWEHDCYARVSHPLITELEKELAKLEGGRYGLAFSWGMSAIATIFLNFLRPLDRIIIAEDLYAGTTSLCREILQHFNIWVDIADTRDPENITKAIQGNTKIIFFETISNPRLWVTDIPAISQIAHEKNILVVVDNTFCTPALCKPLQWGADLVVHSTTKAITGHGDTGGGAIILNNSHWRKNLQQVRTLLGTIQKARDAQQHLLEMRTFFQRFVSQMINAEEITLRLNRHPKVDRVFYPGLLNFPQRELALKLLTGGDGRLMGTIIAFTVKNNLTAAKKFIKALNFITVAVSTGCIESLIQIPFITNSRPDRLGGADLPENLIRFSVGTEDIDLLWQDIDQALEKI